MAHVSKRKALKALRRNLELGNRIIESQDGTEAVNRWLRDTKELLEVIISNSSELYRSFCRIGLGSGAAIVSNIQETAEPVPIASCYLVEHGVRVLKECIQQIEEYGLISERTQRHPLWYGLGIPLAVVVVAAVASLFTSPVQRLLGITPGSNSELTETQREMKCKQLQVLFDNRLQEFGLDYGVARDSLQRLLGRKFPRRTDVNRAEIREFARRMTIRRNNVIDSFLIAFQADGCDTSSLRYTKQALR